MKRITDFMHKHLHARSRNTRIASLDPYAGILVNNTAYVPDNRFDRLAEEGYRQNVIAYRCINLISRGLSSVPFLLYQQDHGYSGNGKRGQRENARRRLTMEEHEIESHPILALLNAPSPLQAGSSFIEEVVSYLLLSGNTYIEAILNGEGKPVMLSAIRPDRVHIKPGRYGVPAAYDVQMQPGVVRTVPVDPRDGRSDILHIKLFHPMNDWYGLSPMEAAAKSIDQHNAVGGHNLALLNNGGRPSGALLVRSRDNGMGLSDAQRQGLRSDLKRAYEGSDNAGRVMILEGDFEWKEMGLTPKDLDFVEGKNVSAREICQAFGVPPMLAGVPGDATFANYREARFHLWEDTILPLLELIVAELNVWLLPYFGESYRLGYDVDGIQALAPKREAAWQKIAHAEFLTMNEKRQAVGYGPVEGGDVLR